MARKNATLKSLPTPPSGFIADSRLCPSAGSLCAIQRRYSKRRLCYAPISTFLPEQIIQWFVRRWQVEVTFHEVRTHLGVETQRQWADLSILRVTPALLSLFSVVTLLANLHARKQKLPVQQTAWYIKKLPTFSDALSIVKETLYCSSLIFEHHSFIMKSEKYLGLARITAFLALLIPFYKYHLDKV